MASPRRPRRSRPADAPVRAIGYLRVSTDGQVESGAGLDAQRSVLIERAARESWTLCLTADEGLSAKDMDRPSLIEALATLDRGDADVLVAAKLDRVSRSVADFARLLERARINGWRLILLDLGVDTSTDAGEFVANTIANSAQYERRIIGTRTREGLAAKRAQGVRLGRPTLVDAETVERVMTRVAAGVGWSAIARELNTDGVPTPSRKSGARWFPATVRQVAHGQAAAAAIPVAS